MQTTIRQRLKCRLAWKHEQAIIRAHHIQFSAVPFGHR
jgi:hypothetical protein